MLQTYIQSQTLQVVSPLELLLVPVHLVEVPLATMSAITTTGATATWAAALGAASYDWEVVPTGNAQGTGVVASGTATTFSGNVASITGLTANTGYDFLISSDCTD